MKAVLLSIHPQYCHFISKGIKTVEVRKTRPRVNVPFKCYVYCTISKAWPAWSGRVIGEFICDDIIYFGNVSSDPWDLLQGSIHEHLKRIVVQDACLSECAMLSYGGRFGWHIKDFLLYDMPRPLTDFFVTGDCSCNYCSECPYFESGNGYNLEDDCMLGYEYNDPQWPYRPLFSAPQSWCYVLDK